jgi:hypothetical protein
MANTIRLFPKGQTIATIIFTCDTHTGTDLRDITFDYMMNRAIMPDPSGFFVWTARAASTNHICQWYLDGISQTAFHIDHFTLELSPRGGSTVINQTPLGIAMDKIGQFWITGTRTVEEGVEIFQEYFVSKFSREGKFLVTHDHGATGEGIGESHGICVDHLTGNVWWNLFQPTAPVSTNKTIMFNPAVSIAAKIKNQDSGINLDDLRGISVDRALPSRLWFSSAGSGRKQMIFTEQNDVLKFSFLGSFGGAAENWGIDDEGRNIAMIRV